MAGFVSFKRPLSSQEIKAIHKQGYLRAAVFIALIVPGIWLMMLEEFVPAFAGIFSIIALMALWLISRYFRGITKREVMLIISNHSIIYQDAWKRKREVDWKVLKSYEIKGNTDIYLYGPAIPLPLMRLRRVDFFDQHEEIIKIFTDKLSPRYPDHKPGVHPLYEG